MPSQSPRQLPVPCQPALPRYPPAAACPASRPHLPLREVSGAPHLLSAFPVSSPSRCRCLETLAGLENFPSVPFRAAAPVNPRLSAHASFIMLGLPLQDPAHAPPLPPGLSGRGRTNPSRKGCDALRPRVSAQSPSRSIRTVPGISQTGRPSAAFPSPPIPRGLLLMPPAAPSARPREEGPGVPEENAEEPRNSPVPQKMRRGDGEAKRRPGGAEKTGRLEETHGAIPPAS